MKKLLLKSMLLLCALVVGSMNGWAGTYNLTPNQASTGTSTSSYITTLTEFEYAGIEWKINQWNPSSLQIKTNQASATSEFRFYNTSAFPGKITQVVLKFSALTLSNTETTGFMFVGGTSEVTATTGGTNGTWNSTAKTITWTPGSSDNFTYFAFYQNGQVATGTNKLATADAIVVTFEGDDIQQCATPAFSPVAGTYGSTQSVELSCGTAGATIRYTTNGATPTKSSTQYSSAISVTATTTIKAKAFKDGMASSSIATATYTILDHAGTQADPYSVADARTAIDANSGGLTGVYATGIVSQIVTAYDSGTGKISFNISTDGQTTSNQLQAYQCVTGDADVSDVRLGDEVVVSGNLTKYNSTYEFASGCQLISMVHATNPIINASNKTIDFDATSGEIPYTIENSTSATLTAAKTTGDWISNVTVDVANSKVTFTATANTGAQRTGTITLSYTGADDKVVTITQKKNAIATLPFSWAGGTSSELLAECGVEGNSLGDYAAGNAPYRVQFNANGDYIQIRTNSQAGVLSFGIKIFNAVGASAGTTITVKGSADGESFSNIQEFSLNGKASGTYTFTTTNAIGTDIRYIRIFFTKGSGTNAQNVGIGPINIALPGEPSGPIVDDGAHTITLSTSTNMAGWRTFYPSKADQAYTTDADVYYASATGESTVTLTKIDDGVPANTPVILHKDGATTIELTETGTDITAPGASNKLTVSTAGQNLGKVFRLGFKSGAGKGVGFYSYTTTSAPAGIIYVSSITAGTRDFLGFDFGDDATGVNEVKAQKVDGDYYNLAGQRVAQPTKGLYIVNGKKVIMK